MTKEIQKKIDDQKLDEAKTFLARVYRETHEGYTTIGLSDLGEKFHLDRTCVSKALINLKIVDAQGKLRGVKYLWTSKDMPNFKMAGDLIREISRLRMNINNRIAEDKKAKQLLAEKAAEKMKEKRNPAVAQPKSKGKISEKYINVLTAFVHKYKNQPFETTLTQALTDFKLPPYFGAVLNGNELIENKQIVKNAVVEAIMHFAVKYNSDPEYKRTLKNARNTVASRTNQSETVATDEPKSEFEKVIETDATPAPAPAPIVTGVSIQTLIDRRNQLYETIDKAQTEIEEVEKVITAYEVIEKYAKK